MDLKIEKVTVGKKGKVAEGGEQVKFDTSRILKESWNPATVADAVAAGIEFLGGSEKDFKLAVLSGINSRRAYLDSPKPDPRLKSFQILKDSGFNLTFEQYCAFLETRK